MEDLSRISKMVPREYNSSRPHVSGCMPEELFVEILVLVSLPHAVMVSGYA
jgi:hypothetical protein